MAHARLLDRGMRLVGTVSAFLAMVSLAFLVVLFVALIALRSVGVSVPSADEFASIALAGTFALGLAAAVAHDEHLELRFVVNLLSEPLRRGLALLAVVLSLVMVAVLLWGMWRLWYEALLRGSTMLGSLPIPRAVPIGVVMAGLGLFEIALALKLARLLARARAPVDGALL